jgi:hypothetical protein
LRPVAADLPAGQNAQKQSGLCEAGSEELDYSMITRRLLCVSLMIDADERLSPDDPFVFTDRRSGVKPLSPEPIDEGRPPHPGHLLRDSFTRFGVHDGRYGPLYEV